MNGTCYHHYYTMVNDKSAPYKLFNTLITKTDPIEFLELEIIFPFLIKLTSYGVLFTVIWTSSNAIDLLQCWVRFAYVALQSHLLCNKLVIIQ